MKHLIIRKPSVFTWERRDYDLLDSISRREALIKNTLIVLFAFAVGFVIVLAWRAWRTHEHSMGIAYVMCVQHVAAHGMNDVSLAANVRELCSQ